MWNLNLTKNKKKQKKNKQKNCKKNNHNNSQKKVRFLFTKGGVCVKGNWGNGVKEIVAQSCRTL